MAPAFGAVITTPERRDPTASAVARPVNKAPRATGSDSDAAKRRPLRASASGEQHRMSARIEAERPRPLGLGSREPVRLAGRALKTVFTAFKNGNALGPEQKGYQASPPSGVATTPWTPSVKRGVDPRPS